MARKVLVLEDESSIRGFIVINLTRAGYEVIESETGEEALEKLRDNPDIRVALLDIMLPGIDGFEVCRRIRATNTRIGIIMLTARSQLEDRVEGLNAGADYYLAKPFDTRELLACVGALLRRQGGQVDELRFGNTVLDLDGSTLACGDRWVRLSAREFDVMRCLMQAKGRNLSKEAILARVWGYDSNAVENHVEVYVGFLRKKLASIGSSVRIEAVRRLGYHLEEDGREA